MACLVCRILDVPAAPFRLARAIASRPGLAIWSSPRGLVYIACDPIERRSALDPEPELLAAPQPRDLHRAPRWLGVLPYECRRELERPGWGRPVEERPAPHLSRPVWLRYGAVAELGDRVRVIGDDRGCVDDLCRLLGRDEPPRPVRVTFARWADTEEEHAARITRALELIEEGQIYQVNLARRLEVEASGRGVDLLARLPRSRFAALFDLGDLQVLGSSPELFLAHEPDGSVRTCPIKGTRPRGQDADADRALRLELECDAKERAELAMVIDVERNDLGRVAKPGSVRVLGRPTVQTFGSVHHRVATVAARLRPGVDRAALLRAVLPSGSVTGAPKVRAMEVIARLEAFRRGLYTGAYGAIGHDGSLALAMAIRTLTVVDGVGHYFSGGGIVADSDPVREVVETRWKARQLAALFDAISNTSTGRTRQSAPGQNLAEPRARR